MAWPISNEEAQVSITLRDYKLTPMHIAFKACKRRAEVSSRPHLYGNTTFLLFVLYPMPIQPMFTYTGAQCRCFGLGNSGFSPSQSDIDGSTLLHEGGRIPHD